eukprot:m.9931 g.9931  ORF g.9931 m.9931 type:complete len:116 (+) comp5506_c0_seq1:1373-1720(+)
MQKGPLHQNPCFAIPSNSVEEQNHPMKHRFAAMSTLALAARFAPAVDIALVMAQVAVSLVQIPNSLVLVQIVGVDPERLVVASVGAVKAVAPPMPPSNRHTGERFRLSDLFRCVK